MKNTSNGSAFPKLTICAAITGSRQKSDHNQNHPITTQTIVEQAEAAWRAGAAIVHCHARTDKGEPTNNAGAYSDIVSELRAANCAAVVNFSAGDVGGRSTHNERVAVVSCGAEIVSIGGGSFNSGHRIYDNGPTFQRLMLDKMHRDGVTPEFELFDFGQISNLCEQISDGHLTSKSFVNLVFGVPGGLPLHLELLPIAVYTLPHEVHWTVVCVTDDPWVHQCFLLQALALGGNIRVGMEDCPFVSPGRVASSNSELVERWASIARALGRELSDEAHVRQKLGISNASSFPNYRIEI